MLFLLFQLGNDRYALEARRVAEVLPLVELRRLPGSPKEVAGVVNYRGRPVPVVDLCQLVLGRPALELLGTRIFVVHCRDAEGHQELLGLIAERATGLLRRDPREFVPAACSGSPSCFGPVASDTEGLIQWVHEDRLLPETARAALFAQLPAGEDEFRRSVTT